MKKWLSSFIMLILLLFGLNAATLAAVPPKIAVNILSPGDVKGAPGIESTINVKITNLTDQPLLLLAGLYGTMRVRKKSGGRNEKHSDY